MNYKKNLKKYAQLIVQMGVNLQKDQELVVSCSVENYDFARMIVKEAYQAGAKEVIVFYNDIKSSRLRYEYGAIDIFESLPQWLADSRNYYAKNEAAFITIVGNDPEALSGVDQEKIKKSAKANHKALAPYYKKMMNSEFQWCVVALPEKEWAKKIFPDLSSEMAMDQLWHAIFKAVRIGEEDVVLAWKNHNANLNEKSALLNDYRFKKLHYFSQNGTDFTLGLQKDHRWQGGSEKTPKGIVFFPNIPTEEIFTCPDCRLAEGTVASSMPLSYQGNLIENFTLTFSEGKVIDFSAEKGYEILKMLLETDEGAKRLGEVALVPNNSPIATMNLLFYETLFDENASCHLALGECYPTTIKGGERLDKEGLLAIGGNQSQIHVDFMIGCDDLSIIGITEDGKEIPIFINGNWA